MRDINRIKPFLNKIEEFWKNEFPDLRFGQVIYIIAEELKHDDIFFPEEDEWLEAIQKIIDKSKIKD